MRTLTTSRPRIRRQRRNGFALVVTLALMLLLVVIAVGLLQLATITVRSVNQEGSLAQARANARMSLMLAIGQLQKEMGLDAKISATAGILDTTPDTPAAEGVAQPQWTGVWDASVSQLDTFTLDRPRYTKTFKSWLVSGADTDTKNVDLAKNGPAGVTTTLVPAGAVANREVRVSVLAGQNAGFAWWTSDNGVKATVQPNEETDATSTSKILLAARRSEADGHAELEPRLPKRAQGLDQRFVDIAAADAALANPAGEGRVATKYIHDLTTASETVPVDVTTSRLRQCMNLYLDYLEATPSARTGAGTLGALGRQGPTADYRICSWDQLRNYQSLARQSSSRMLRLGPSGRPLMTTHQERNADEPEWNPQINRDRFRVQPVLLKYAFVVSYDTEKLSSTTPGVDPNKPYALRMYLYPIVVLWNPYNVDLEVPEYCAHAFCPLTFDTNSPLKPQIDLTLNQSATLLSFGPAMYGTKMTNLIIPAGATKVLYPQPLRWRTNPSEYRYTARGFPYHYYMWAQTQKFNLGDPDPTDPTGKPFCGGVLKNLRGNNEVSSFNSQPAAEIVGAAGETLTIKVNPSPTVLNIAGAHTDWWGNNGPDNPSDSAETLQRFGMTTSAGFKFEPGSPRVSLPLTAPPRTYGEMENRPTPLLLYEFYRKAADEPLVPAKHGSFSVAGNPFEASTDTTLGADPILPWFESPYTFRYNAVNSWTDALKYFQLPPDREDRIYFGNSYTASKGQLNVVDQEIPLSPLVSLSQLQHLPLFDYRPTYDTFTASGETVWWTKNNGGDYAFHEGRVTQFPQNHAIGNSYASPGIGASLITTAGWSYNSTVGQGTGGPAVVKHLRRDRSYIANAVLWDAWYCSSLAAQDGLMLKKDVRTARQVAQDLFKSGTPPPNDAVVARTKRAPDDLLNSLFTGNTPKSDAYQKLAEFIRIQGGFNVNSVSEEAWAHFLSGLLSRPQMVMESVKDNEVPKVEAPQPGKFLIARNTLSNAPPAERTTGKEQEDRYWNGSREVTAAQIRELAKAIVVQVKKRGPFTSLAEFVNRRVVSTPELAVSGALQSALDDPGVSINAPFRGDMVPTSTSAGSPRYPFPSAATGPRRQGITGYVTQADLLNTLGPRITPRSDTFTIRALGESRDANGKVRSRAWCEAVVQRTAAYVDPSDAATTPGTTASLKQPNKIFGRRFEMVSFRWLNPEEVQTRS